MQVPLLVRESSRRYFSSSTTYGGKRATPDREHKWHCLFRYTLDHFLQCKLYRMSVYECTIHRAAAIFRRTALEDGSLQVHSMRNGFVKYQRLEERIETKAIFHMKTSRDEYPTDR
jgi:hypothetical protein